MPAKTLRVVIPKNVGDLLELSSRIYVKHQNDGSSSPLAAMADYNWDTIGPNLTTALEHHTRAEMLRRQMEEEYESRDKLMGDIDGTVRATRDVLKGINAKSPKKMGEWGFTVNDTPKAKSSNSTN